MIKGSFTALITPFKKDGSIDIEKYAELIERQIKEGTEGLVPCGTTGETPSLTEEEHLDLVKVCVDVAGGRLPVFAGAGSNNTMKTISMAQKLQNVGVDGILVVTPYYNKPPQEALFRHYEAVHNATDIPIMLYNVPSRTGVDLAVDTVARISELPRIVGVKDATNDLTRPVKTRLLVKKDNFCQFSGEDATVVAFLAQGGDGCISVSSNVAPALCAKVHKAWRKGDMETLHKTRDLLQPLHTAMFTETSPGPCKYAMERLGLCSSYLRQPLWEISEKSKKIVDDALEKVGLLG